MNPTFMKLIPYSGQWIHNKELLHEVFSVIEGCSVFRKAQKWVHRETGICEINRSSAGRQVWERGIYMGVGLKQYGVINSYKELDFANS